MEGYFITIEGPDGSGKTTQLALLAKYLKEKSYQVVLTREPGGTPLAEKIRELVLDPKMGQVYPATEALLYAASRAQHVAEVIIPALKSGKIVLSDRFADSSIVYQCFGRGLQIQEIIDMNRFATQGLEPNLTILLDLTPEEGMVRLSKRKADQQQELDRFEQECLDFYYKVREGYLTLAKMEVGRFEVISGADSVEKIQEQIIAAVNKHILV